MSEIHIKPCPFCGSENISFNAFSILSDAYVLCEQCNASIEISVPWDDMDEKEHDKVCFEKLSVLWNKRASERNQPELNENQQIVLDWLKNDMLDDSDFYNTIYNSRFLHVNGVPQRKENIAFMKLKNKELAQVIQAFSQWALEQEEAE
ncbi:Lar family restriction alleviation protein [Enterococcus faecalis]|uniref:Lar family restriction alleviation protein n=1 Tax=Enterococcus faecalis TaxID=1351 RepID=UPI002455EED6|nr:Lar family restriction alleviation protein [Enterococcus faecalis]MDH5056713.1 Lar family restriction alleviation protein [Enterococcus faecalis]